MPLDPIQFRRRLLRWYDQNRRPLPWRESNDPWRVLVSEFMLQQTRVETVIPYFHRFLEQFPDPSALAAASEAEVLSAWSGLGYYSRARNLQRAAALVAAGFPSDYDGIRALPGVGPYSAAAVASIALALPHAAVDGNVLRVIARLTGDSGDIASPSTKRRFAEIADGLLDTKRPGDFNQAMMELGATVCLPRAPRCLLCPVTKMCRARQEARQNELPVKKPAAKAKPAELTVIVFRRGDSLLLKQVPAAAQRMAGFWELPQVADLPGLATRPSSSFNHTIVQTRYAVSVLEAVQNTYRKPAGLKWFPFAALTKIPVTTITRKALELTLRSLSSTT